MALAPTEELNLFRESVAVAPDAVPLPCWLWSHYYPCLFPETGRETFGHHGNGGASDQASVWHHQYFYYICCMRLWAFTPVLNVEKACVCACRCVCIRAAVCERSDAAALNHNHRAPKPRAHLRVRKHYGFNFTTGHNTFGHCLHRKQSCFYAF